MCTYFLPTHFTSNFVGQSKNKLRWLDLFFFIVKSIGILVKQVTLKTFSGVFTVGQADKSSFTDSNEIGIGHCRHDSKLCVQVFEVLI